MVPREGGGGGPWAVELGLTLVHAALYGSLFAFAYLQLWLLFCSREKRLSYRSVCLFLCLAWAALRTVLFAFYLQGALQGGPRRRLPPFAHWLLFCCPVCLLFATLCLLSLYFAECGKPRTSGFGVFRLPFPPTSLLSGRDAFFS
ncbi:UNVERIFIED_CONTAM: hypothetical protein K2H54_010613 [Gekko kuhli]